MFHFLQTLVLICSFFSVIYQVEAQMTNEPEINFLNVDKVWRENKITGKNILVAVLDDGVSYNHPDLRRNYNWGAGYDFIDNDTIPLPVLDSLRWTSHGTKCAGVIAAKENGTCRTGVAYQARMTGIRIFSKSPHGADKTAAGLAHNKENIDIYSCSWGPSDNGYSTKGPGADGKKALKDGALQGRNGKGSVYVFSSGNGGFFGDSCAFDGYVNSIYTIAIAAVTKTGRVPRYAESCSSVIASTYGDEVKTCDVYGCNSRFGKTSSAASFASGIIALLLEANNKLTWRDVQHLIIRTSNPKKTKVREEDWVVNGAGLMVHPSIGFGVMDAKKVVDLAQKWRNSVPQQISCSVQWNSLNKTIKNRDGIEIPFNSLVQHNKECSSIKFLEHVQVELSLSYSPRANLLMYLISPEETESQLLYDRIFDAITQRTEYRALVITSLHFWGENPMANNRTWKVRFKSASFRRPSQVQLRKLKFTFYGTADNPISKISILPTGTILCGGKMVWKGYGTKCCTSSTTYNPKHERCCFKSRKIVDKNPLCGGKKYNKCKKLCCNGKALYIGGDSEEMLCCGQEKYSKTTHGCCGHMKYRMEDQVCCGEKIYPKKYPCIYLDGWLQDWFTHELRCRNRQSPIYVPIYPYLPCNPSTAGTTVIPPTTVTAPTIVFLPPASTISTTVTPPTTVTAPTTTTLPNIANSSTTTPATPPTTTTLPTTTSPPTTIDTTPTTVGEIGQDNITRDIMDMEWPLDHEK